MEQEVTNAWNRHKFIGGFTELVSNYGNIFTPAVMVRANVHLDEASRLAGNDAKLKERIDFVRTGAEYTSLMGQLLNTYDKLGRAGFPLSSFEWQASAEGLRKVLKSVDAVQVREYRENFEKRLKEPFTFTLAQKDAWLIEAWDLGQKRVEILNRNRQNFALDEGLLASAIENDIRKWHQTVGEYLGKPKSDIAVLIYTPRPPKAQP
jgi:hypothetical protein